MTETAERRRIWDRPATRRAVLAGGAAAGGTAAAVVGLALGQAEGETPAGVGDEGTDAAASPTSTPSPSATATPATGTIAEPERRAAHLLRRAGFGGTLAEIAEFAALDRDEAASRLIDYETVDNSALDQRLAELGLDDLYHELANPGDMGRWWLLRMAYSARPLEERMTLIWHGLLTTQVSQIGGQRAKLMVGQNELFRSMALPVYDDLLQAISKDPAMMIYLNTVDSSAEHPNENYARELMELYSMGEGNYTEDDVREAARAFTGWRFTPPRRVTDRDDQEARDQAFREWEPEFFLAARNHDFGTKTFLGQTGAWDGDDIVRIIMEQPATGRFMTTRLFREFVHNHPTDEDIDALVAVWDATGHNVREVVRTILTSDAFYSEEAYRAKVRSPIELIVGAVRGLELEATEIRADQRTLPTMGQVPFEPPSVAGWPGGAAWLSSGTFFARLNFVDLMLFGSTISPDGRRQDAPRAGRARRIPGVSIPLLEGAADAGEAVDTALAALTDGNVPDEARQAMVDYVATAATPQERAAAAAYLALGSPEYQTV